MGVGGPKAAPPVTASRWVCHPKCRERLAVPRAISVYWSKTTPPWPPQGPSSNADVPDPSH